MQHRLQPNRRTIAAVLAVALTYCFLLALSQGFVTSGDDWFFTSRTMDENLYEAVMRGIGSAVGHYRSTNGRLLGNAMSKAFGCSELWREVVRCAIILGVVLLLCRTAKVSTGVQYAIALGLTVALPADIYAQSYAWAAGFFNYVPPILAIFAYILRADRVLSGSSDSAAAGLGMFLMALAAQWFVENVSIGLVLLSVCVLVWHLAANKKWSWSLAGFLAGSILGCGIMFAAPGYSNVNVEGYRQVSKTFGELMNVVISNFSSITMYLTERNWLIIAPLTGAAIVLLCRCNSEKEWVKWLRLAALVCLMVCPVYFYANYHILSGLSYIKWIDTLSFLLDVAANLCYLLAVLAAVLLGIADKSRRQRGVLCILAVPMIFAPLVVVTPIGPRCMYIPYMLLVCLLVLMVCEILEQVKPEHLKWLSIPAALVLASVLVTYLWIAIWNGHCERVRVRQIEQGMEAQVEKVELPSYPYMNYVHSPNGDAIHYYYYYQQHHDLTFTFVPYGQWVKG